MGKIFRSQWYLAVQLFIGWQQIVNERCSRKLASCEGDLDLALRWVVQFIRNVSYFHPPVSFLTIFPPKGRTPTSRDIIRSDGRVLRDCGTAKIYDARHETYYLYCKAVYWIPANNVDFVGPRLVCLHSMITCIFWFVYLVWYWH